jgi:hypothetical protein
VKEPTTVTELPGELADCDQAMLCKLFGAPSTPADALPSYGPAMACTDVGTGEPGDPAGPELRATAPDNPVPADEPPAEPIKNVELRQLHPKAPRWDENGLSPQPGTIGFSRANLCSDGARTGRAKRCPGAIRRPMERSFR